MKKIILALATLVVFAACSQNPYSDKSLAKSFALNVDSSLQQIATEKGVRISMKIHAPNGKSYYTGYDGRTKQPITDFGGTIDIGSCSKMLTATAVLQLIEQKKISLDTKLVDLLPNDSAYKNLHVINDTDYISSITVLQLLNHTSGLPEYFLENDDDKEIAQHGDSSLRFRPWQLVELAKKTNKAGFKPGTGFKYCNTGYILLGLIIEKISGIKYEDYIQQHILDPLNMKHTYFATTNSPANRAPGHFKGKPSAMPATLAWSAGLLVSTLDDMDVFIRNWNDAKLFNAETANMVKTKNFSEMGMGITYGMGVINLLGTSYGHAGQTFGFQAYMAILPNGYSFCFGVDDASVSAWDLAFLAVTAIKDSK